MSKLLITLLSLAGLGFAGSAAAAQTFPASNYNAPINEAAYGTAKKDVDAKHDADKKACSQLSANAKDICLAKAKGNAAVNKADAEAAFRNTPKARESARLARAEAIYQVEKEVCDDLAGNSKDVCVKQAKAGLAKGKAEAKVDRVAADVRQEGAEKRKEGADKRNEARTEANADTRDAKYKVALEKCQAMSGDSKSMCVNNAKSDFGKS